MRKLLVVVVMLLMATAAAWAWNYDKAVAKYIQGHPDAPASTLAALKAQALEKGLDKDAARIVGKFLTRRKGPIGGWFYAEVREVNNQDESGLKIGLVEFYYEVAGDTTYVQNSNLNVVASAEGASKRIVWLTLTFENGALTKWNLLSAE